MNEWFVKFICMNPTVRPPPPHDPQTTNVASPVTDTVRREKPPVDKIRKQGVEEFRATKDDDTGKAKFWLKNTIKVFDELSCTPEECMKCVVSLLQTWPTIVGRHLFSSTEREGYLGFLSGGVP